MDRHAIRAAFSFLAAAVTLYMSAEHAELFIKKRYLWAGAVALVCAGLAVMEFWKVGRRVESLMGLR